MAAQTPDLSSELKPVMEGLKGSLHVSPGKLQKPCFKYT